jgi:hypothetical protein
MVVLMVGACTGGEVFADLGQDLREHSVADRWSNMKRATSLFPNPTDLTNFPMRGALLKFTERQDLVNHPWYTYILPIGSEQAFYFTTEQYPESVCNFLGSTEDIRSGDSGKVVVTAPSYDGVFYSNCPDDQYFVFDQQTDAMIVFGGPVFHITSDQPLSIYANAVPVTVSQP